MTRTTLDLDAAVRTFYAEIDANHPDVFRRRFTTDARFAFNDVPPVAGADPITEFVAAWKGNFRSVTHEPLHHPASRYRSTRVSCSNERVSPRPDGAGCTIDRSGER